MFVPLWLFVLFVAAAAWAIVITLLFFYHNPLPFPDRGHRCFAVPNIKAAAYIGGILRDLGGLSEKFTFFVGGTTQTLFSDNTTVLITHDSRHSVEELPPNALSLVSHDPTVAARAAAQKLQTAGFQAKVHLDVIPTLGDKLVAVSSNAFDGWILIFRRHALAMGKPPGMCKIIQ